MSAALSGLYSSSPFSRNITYHELHNTDIKKLVSVLRDWPSDPKYAKEYFHNMKKAIHDLPHQLRSRPSTLTFTSRDSKDSKLCPGHNGLNTTLINSIWTSLRFEFDHGLGHFLYPLIVHAGLPSAQEWKLRQLEPVLEMWRADFNIIDHTPAGREPIHPMETVDGVSKPKWRFQQNACAACMLSRIGSAENVLVALLASMVGKFSSKSIGTKDDIKSRRVRFVRYWIKKFPGGDKLADEAWDFGREMRRVRRAWKDHVKGVDDRRSGFYGRASLQYGGSLPARPARSSGIGVDISPAFHPGFREASTTTNPSTGGNSRGRERPVSQETVSDIGIDLSEPYTPRYAYENPFERPANPTPNRGHRLSSTLRSMNSQTHSQEPHNIHSVHSQHASLANTGDYCCGSDSQVPSAHGSRHDSLMPRPLRTPNRQHPAIPNPNPDRRSMYAGFGEGSNDTTGMYDGYDVSPPDSPAMLVDAGVNGKRTTKWSDMY